MKTQPIENLLPQEIDPELKVILKGLSLALSEIVNFGTHILSWDLEFKRNIKDSNIPTVFLRNILELADAIAILIAKSSIDSSKILLRSLLENSFSLMYLIEKDEINRVHAFLVCRANKDIRYYKQFIKEEQTSKSFVNKIKKQEPDFEINNICNPEEIKNVLKAKIELLEEPIYKDVQKEYTRTCNKKEKKNNNPNWYSLYNGPENFEQLSEHLQYTIIYEFHYRKYSENVHINNVLKGFVKSGYETADIIQIRDFQDCREVCFNSINLLLDLYKEFIIKRIPHKDKEFQDWAIKFEKLFEQIYEATKFKYKK